MICLKLICWKQVNTLCEEVGDDVFASVFDVFLEEVEEALGGLAQIQDPKQLEAALHFLRGSALSLGFNEFARLCGDGEKQAGNNELQVINLSAVKDCYEASKQEFIKEKFA